MPWGCLRIEGLQAKERNFTNDNGGVSFGTLGCVYGGGGKTGI